MLFLILTPNMHYISLPSYAWSSYADRARMIKNKPILNRADPKDAELARLRSLVSQLQTRLAKGIGLPLVSPCRPLTSSQGGSTFSANVLSTMAETTAKLEVGSEYCVDLRAKLCRVRFSVHANDSRAVRSLLIRTHFWFLRRFSSSHT